MSEPLRFVVCTPQRCVFDGAVVSVRLPTETGQLGLRTRGEPFLTVVEPGLIVLHEVGGTVRYVASSGGPLRRRGGRCELYAAFAAVGTQDAELLAELDRVLHAPDSEPAMRRRIELLEREIMREASDRGAPLRSPFDG